MLHISKAIFNCFVVVGTFLDAGSVVGLVDYVQFRVSQKYKVGDRHANTWCPGSLTC